MSFKINGNQGSGPLGVTGNARQTDKARTTDGIRNDDKVSFSSMFGETQRVRPGDVPADATRMAKIDALKAQVAEGSYRPDLNRVAASLLQFIAEGKK